MNIQKMSSSSTNLNVNNPISSLERVKSCLGNRNVQLIAGSLVIAGAIITLGLGLGGVGAMAELSTKALAATVLGTASVGTGLLVHGLFKAPHESPSLKERAASVEIHQSTIAPLEMPLPPQTKSVVEAEDLTQAALERIQSEQEAAQTKKSEQTESSSSSEVESETEISLPSPTIASTWKQTTLKVVLGLAAAAGLGYLAYNSGCFKTPHDGGGQPDGGIEPTGNFTSNGFCPIPQDKKTLLTGTSSILDAPIIKTNQTEASPPMIAAPSIPNGSPTTPPKPYLGTTIRNKGSEFISPEINPENPFQHVKPKTWTQSFQSLGISIYQAIFGRPDAQAMRAKGKQVLQEFGTTIDKVAQYPLNPAKDTAYRTEWMMREECPADLDDYLAYQKQHGYFNKLPVDALRDLFGDTPDLSDSETRKLYNLIDGAIPKAQELFQTDNCLDAAVGGSTIRSNARDYARYIRMKDEAQIAILDRRDLITHGTSTLDPLFILGKYGSADKAATCTKISAGAQKTNAFYNAHAGIKKDPTPPTPVAAKPTVVQTAPAIEEGDHLPTDGRVFFDDLVVRPEEDGPFVLRAEVE